MHIHLDPLGGWSGDMFAAALLDAFPEFWPEILRAVQSLGLGEGAACRLVDHKDHVLTGRRFIVAAEAAALPEPAHGDHDHGGHHHHGHPLHPYDRHDPSDHAHASGDPHAHRSWASIRAAIAAAPLDARAKHHATEIFTRLAEAEARVHGIAVDDVAFHEVGAVDSIVDIVVAARIIAAVEPCTWSAAPLPLGSGRVSTAHGVLPVPTPATALLLEGLAVIDDGIAGERVTPTGAAIARHLLAGNAMIQHPGPRRLARSGTGFGARVVPGISNCLRALVYEPVSGARPEATDAPHKSFAHRELGVIAFEVDDQSAEDLSLGLDHIRALPGIHDVIQSAAFGKKGRMATHVQVLAAPEALQAAILACFEETTTIGLRYHLVRGAALSRGFAEVDVDGRRLRVKSVQRPNGDRSAKAEASDVAAERSHMVRMRLRRRAEAAVVEPCLRPSETAGVLSS